LIGNIVCLSERKKKKRTEKGLTKGERAGEVVWGACILGKKGQKLYRKKQVKNIEGYLERETKFGIGGGHIRGEQGKCQSRRHRHRVDRFIVQKVDTPSNKKAQGKKENGEMQGNTM